MTNEEALVIAIDALTDIVNLLNPALGVYETQIATVVRAVVLAEAALLTTNDAHDEACHV